MYRLEPDQIKSLVEIIREESGDHLCRAEFTDAMLRLFENIPGFETLPRKDSRRYVMILWQSYQTAHRAPEQSARNRQ